MRNAFVCSLVLLLLVAQWQSAVACPFCTVERATLAEEMAGSDAVVLAKLVKPAAQSGEGPNELGQFGVVDPDTGMAKFRVVKVLVGEEVMTGIEEIEAVFFGEANADQLYFIRGSGTDRLDWNIPIAVSPTAAEYVEHVLTLPENGAGRMEYFLPYLQHEDPLLAQDAYDEFARAPYSDLVEISEGFDREKLWQWLIDPMASANRRSLYFTMLGIVGTEEDQHRLEEMMLADNRVLRSAAEAAAAASMGLGGAITLPVMPEMIAMEQRQKQLGFNAMVGCYLKLTGAEGLDLLDREFLSSESDDPTKVYGMLLALRFLGDETDDVPLERLCQSMRLILAKPDAAEQAIRDLARWEDWGVLDQLVTMFKEADKSSYVRDTIVAYLDQAAKQQGEVGEKATAALAELEPLDPKAFKRARTLTAFGFLGYARAGSRPADTAPALNKPTAEDSAADSGEESSDASLATADSSDAPTLEEPDAAIDSQVSDSAAVKESADAVASDQPQAPADTPDTEAVAAETAGSPANQVADSTDASHDGLEESSTDPAIQPPTRGKAMIFVLVAAGVLVVLVWGVMRGGG
ncbi:hypothetical protein [Aeoliella mucimassa]|uniref:HEAT repeat domain-containing protein n=1 Tax=Aeoliella mucimassa TaxID=2527972 RepID=A0A518AWH0_9BACT|nr:hypothetical protein [Aeoliella mucimassa]QDU59040.1 hypothetical protein Pan181_52810 [Aeoliella mucimassa]